MARRKPAGRPASKKAAKRPTAKRRRKRDTAPVEAIDDPALPLLRGAVVEEFPQPRADGGQVRWRPDTFKPGLAMDAHGNPVYSLVMRDAPPEAGPRVQRAMAAAARQRQRTEKHQAARQRVADGRELLAEVEARLKANKIELIDKRQRMLAALPKDVRDTLALLTRHMQPTEPASSSPQDIATYVDEVERMRLWAFETGFVMAVERYRDLLTGNPEVDRILAADAGRLSGLRVGNRTQTTRKMKNAVEAQQMYDAGVPVSEIASRVRRHPETVRGWLRELAAK